MVFKPREKRQNLDLKLDISNCAIEQVKETMFLGVILDENPHGNNILLLLQGKFLKQPE